MSLYLQVENKLTFFFFFFKPQREHFEGNRMALSSAWRAPLLLDNQKSEGRAAECFLQQETEYSSVFLTQRRWAAEP